MARTKKGTTGSPRNEQPEQAVKVRTTVYLTPLQHRALKVHAAQNGVDMSAVIADLLTKAGIG